MHEDGERQEESWEDAPAAAVFREVRLRLRRVPPSPSSDSAAKPVYEAVERSFCRVQFDPPLPAEDREPASVVEFVLGEAVGHPAEPESPSAPSGWHPPSKLNEVAVPPWATEAALLLRVGEEAEVEALDASASGGLAGRRRLKLLQLWRASDLLGNGSLLLRYLDPGLGEKPRHLARVTATWRVWFQKNCEELFAWAGREFILDDGVLMMALELAMQAMEEGSRAVLRMSETWALGPLTPEEPATAILQGGAGVWVELALLRVRNELLPGEHGSVEEAVQFAAQKKEQGNRAFAKKTAAEDDRALRRYWAGIRALDALLPGPPTPSLGSVKLPLPQARSHGPSATAEEAPRIEELLSTLQLNCAQVEFRRGAWQAVVDLCGLVLRRRPESAKARYRRGLARAELGDSSGAAEDLKSVVLANPSDAGVRRELAKLEAAIRESRAVEKRTFGGVFERMQQQEERARKAEARRSEAEARAANAEQPEERGAAEQPVSRGSEQPVSEQPVSTGSEAAQAGLETPAAAESATDTSSPKGDAKVRFSTDAEVREIPAEAPAGGDTSRPPDPPPLDGATESQTSKPLSGTRGMWTPMSAPPSTGQEEVDEKAQEILKELQKTRPGLRLMKDLPTVKDTPPIEYQMPSFLRKKKKPASGS